MILTYCQIFGGCWDVLLQREQKTTDTIMAIFTESSNRQLKQPGAAAEGRIARFGSAQPRTNGLIKPS